MKHHINLDELKNGLSEIFPTRHLSPSQLSVAGKYGLHLITFEQETGVVFITCHVGVKPEEGSTELFENLLNFNTSWSDTGGMTMSMGKPGNSIYLNIETTMVGFDLLKAVNLILAFDERAHVWREMISKYHEEAPDQNIAHTAVPEEMFIRV